MIQKNSYAVNFDSRDGENLRVFKLSKSIKLSITNRLFGIPEFLPGDGFLELVKLLKLLDNRDVSSVA